MAQADGSGEALIKIFPTLEALPAHRKLDHVGRLELGVEEGHCSQNVTTLTEVSSNPGMLLPESGTKPNPSDRLSA